MLCLPIVIATMTVSFVVESGGFELGINATLLVSRSCRWLQSVLVVSVTEEITL
jgi:hypothetical protein